MSTAGNIVETAGLEILGCDTISEAACRAAGTRHAAIRIEIARSDFGIRHEGTFAAYARDEIDNATNRVGAIDGRSRAPQHFHSFKIAQRIRAEIELAVRRRGIVEPDAVEQGQGMFGIGAARENGRQAARASALYDAQAGHGLERVGGCNKALELDFRARNDVGSGCDAPSGGVAARGGHDDLVALKAVRCRLCVSRDDQEGHGKYHEGVTGRGHWESCLLRIVPAPLDLCYDR
ncbi:hypothetical protein P7B04_25450 [Sphingobium yanoikuyae]|nr:hypothetical protein [Sphingobium yanoikuyae]